MRLAGHYLKTAGRSVGAVRVEERNRQGERHPDFLQQEDVEPGGVLQEPGQRHL